MTDKDKDFDAEDERMMEDLTDYVTGGLPTKYGYMFSKLEDDLKQAQEALEVALRGSAAFQVDIPEQPLSEEELQHFAVSYGHMMENVSRNLEDLAIKATLILRTIRDPNSIPEVMDKIGMLEGHGASGNGKAKGKRKGPYK